MASSMMPTTDSVPWRRSSDDEEDEKQQKKKASEEEELRLGKLKEKAAEEDLRIQRLKEEELRKKQLEEEKLQLQLLCQKQELRQRQLEMQKKLEMELQETFKEDMKKLEEQSRRIEQEFEEMELESQRQQDADNLNASSHSTVICCDISGDSHHSLHDDHNHSNIHKSPTKRLAEKILNSPSKLVGKLKSVGRKTRCAIPMNQFGHNTLNMIGGFNLYKKLPSNAQFCTTENEFEPKHGEVYLIRCQRNESLADIVKCDNQLWLNQGVKQDKNIKLSTHSARSKAYLDYMLTPIKERGEEIPKKCTLQWKKFVFELKDDKYKETSLDCRHVIVHYVGRPEFALYNHQEETYAKKNRSESNQDVEPRLLHTDQSPCITRTGSD